MSSRSLESAVIEAPIDVVWKMVRPLNFSFLKSVQSSRLLRGASPTEVGSMREVVFRDSDKTHQKLKLVELSDADYMLSYDVVESEPSIRCMASAHSIKCRRISETQGTFIQYLSEFSRDVDESTLADAKWHQLDFFQALRDSLGDVSKQHRGSQERRESSNVPVRVASSPSYAPRHEGRRFSFPSTTPSDRGQRRFSQDLGHEPALASPRAQTTPVLREHPIGDQDVHHYEQELADLRRKLNRASKEASDKEQHARDARNRAQHARDRIAELERQLVMSKEREMQKIAEDRRLADEAIRQERERQAALRREGAKAEDMRQQVQIYTPKEKRTSASDKSAQPSSSSSWSSSMFGPSSSSSSTTSSAPSTSWSSSIFGTSSTGSSTNSHAPSSSSSSWMPSLGSSSSTPAHRDDTHREQATLEILPADRQPESSRIMSAVAVPRHTSVASPSEPLSTVPLATSRMTQPSSYSGQAKTPSVTSIYPSTTSTPSVYSSSGTASYTKPSTSTSTHASPSSFPKSYTGSTGSTTSSVRPKIDTTSIGPASATSASPASSRSTGDETQRSQEVFEKIDWDTIDRGTERDIDEVWSIFDSDHDGKLNKKEAISLVESLLMRIAHRNSDTVNALQNMFSTDEEMSRSMQGDYFQDNLNELQKRKLPVARELVGRLTHAHHSDEIDKSEFHALFSGFLRKKLYELSRGAILGY